MSKKHLTLLSSSKPLSRSRRRVFPTVKTGIELFMPYRVPQQETDFRVTNVFNPREQPKLRNVKTTSNNIAICNKDCHIENKS
jgi:hypothetical protein